MLTRDGKPALKKSVEHMNSPDWTQIERELPELSIVSARFIGEGWNARAFVVNEELVFRFPKRAEQ